MGGFGADASGGGRHGVWGSGGGGVGGRVADLEGLGPQGCEERGGAGTLTCGNGPGGLIFHGDGIVGLGALNRAVLVRENSAGMWQWCKETNFRLGQ